MPHAIAVLLILAQFTVSQTGELRLRVVDPAGRPLPGAAVELVSDAKQVDEQVSTAADGTATVQRLPFGTYVVTVRRKGFAPRVGRVEIRSALPAFYTATLAVAAITETIEVTAGGTLLDDRQTALAQRLGAETLQHRTAALPGRALPELVNTQPGWLLEANGVLHPRGSEYQTQFVVDGLPMTDNRSPVFAPEPAADDVQAMTIMTGGYPAEYGRKLGGVIEVVTTSPARQGFGASISTAAGSFGTRSGDAILEYGTEKTTIGVTTGAAVTNRYLDPPVEE